MLTNAQSSFIKNLKTSLQNPLPGIEAQLRMAHVARHEANPTPENAKMASVLALLYPRKHQWYIVLIERVTNSGDRHSGQISLPGGRYDQTDDSLAFTALREAHEEVGVIIQNTHLLGSLTSLYIPVSNFLVHPFVGFTDTHPVFTPELQEVKSILEVPLNDFLIAGNQKVKNLKINPQITLQNVPYFDIQGKTIWGATAMILSELSEVVQSIQHL